MPSASNNVLAARPKKRRDVANTLERTLEEKITCKEGELTHEMPADEAVLYKQICKAMQDDQTAFAIIDCRDSKNA